MIEFSNSMDSSYFTWFAKKDHLLYYCKATTFWSFEVSVTSFEFLCCLWTHRNVSLKQIFPLQDFGMMNSNPKPLSIFCSASWRWNFQMASNGNGNCCHLRLPRNASASSDYSFPSQREGEACEVLVWRDTFLDVCSICFPRSTDIETLYSVVYIL